MRKFSVPAFIITDVIGNRRHIGRRNAMLDSVIAGTAGSVTFGIILAMLSKPRQPRSAGLSLGATLSVTTEGNTVVNLAWTTLPGTAITYTLSRTDPGESASEVIASKLSGNSCSDDNDGDAFDAGTYTYSVSALSGTSTLPIVPPATVTVTIPSTP